jgi:hypothetical protein
MSITTERCMKNGHRIMFPNWAHREIAADCARWLTPRREPTTEHGGMSCVGNYLEVGQAQGYNSWQ